jgi:hypothetical protein
MVVAKIKNRLSVSKQAVQIFIWIDLMSSYTMWNTKSRIGLKSQTGLQLWKTSMMMMMWISVGFGKVLREYISLSHRESKLL